MFKIREDLYARRERADKLKIAFATAASAGLGLGTAWGLGELHGIGLYASGMSCLLMSYFHSKSSDRGQNNVFPFPPVQEIADRLSKKMDVPSPKIYISCETENLIARASGNFIEIGLDFWAHEDERDIQCVLGHEIGHIHNKDSDSNFSLLNFGLPMISSAVFLSSPRAASFLYLGLMMQYFLYKAVSRIQEFRADRFELRHTDRPLSLAIWLQTQGLLQSGVCMEDLNSKTAQHDGVWKNLRSPSRWRGLHNTHPSVGQRIKALVQLCERVPDAPSGCPRTLSPPPAP